MKHNRNYNFRSYGEQSDNKRKILIIIAIVLVVALVIAVAVVGIVSAVNKKKEAQLAEDQKQLAAIQIARLPHKTSYYCGEFFDKTGLLVYTITKGNGINQINVDDCEITGFDSSVPVEEQVITVTYKGFTDTFNIEIKAPLSETPVLVKIEMENLPKTQYKVGEDLDVTGGSFIATYSDGTTKTIKLANRHIFGFRDAYESGVGEYDITVKLVKDGIEATTTYKITITE